MYVYIYIYIYIYSLILGVPVNTIITTLFFFILTKDITLCLLQFVVSMSLKFAPTST